MTHFNFNESLVTVTSPNQTGETLPRDYRTGTISSPFRNLTLLFAILTMSLANVGMAWGVEATPAAAGTYTIGNNKPGGENRFLPMSSGSVYNFRNNNSSYGDNGCKLKGNDNAVIIYLGSSMNLTATCYLGTSNKGENASFTVYTIAKASFDEIIAKENQYPTDGSSRTVSISTTGTQTSFTVAISSTASKGEYTGSPAAALPAGYYYIVGSTPADGQGAVYLKNIILTASSCTSYSFHYGPHTGDWETPICFTKVGSTHEWNITDFTIPSHTNGEFYVGYAGSTNSQSQTKAWTDTYSDGNGAMKLLPTSNSIVGQATGAVGTINIWDDSGWKNQNVGFTPNGYGITYGGVGHAFNTTATANMWETDVVTLPDVSTTYTMGLATATTGTYVICAHSSAAEAISNMGVTILEGGKKKILLAPGSFNDAGAVYAVWDVTNSAWGDGTTKLFTDADGDGVWECPVASSCTSINLVRMSSGTTTSNIDWSRKWNQTANISVGDLLNKYTITSLSGDNCPYSTTAIHPATGGKGKFRMWANSGDNNWFVHWIPYYVLTYDANGGSGAPSAQSVNSEASPCQLTVSTTEPTRTDYIFEGWSTSSSAASPDDAWDPGDTHAMTGDVTLYAVWTACSGPTINSFAPTGKTDGTYEVGTTLGSITVTATAGNGGALSYLWYQYDGGNIGAAVAAAGTNNAATYNIPNNAACVERHYYCVVSEAGCSTTRTSDASGALTLTEPVDPCSEPAEVANEIARFFVPCGTSAAYNVADQASSTGDNTYTTTGFNGTRDINATTGFIYGKLTDDDNYIQIKLNTGNFRAGDVVNAYFNNNKDNNNLKLKNQSTGNALGAASASGYDSEYVRTYTLTAADIESDGTIKFFRKGSDIRVNRIIVTREPACFDFYSGTKYTSDGKKWDVAVNDQITTDSKLYSSGAVLTGGTITNTSSNSAKIGCNSDYGLVFDSNDKQLTITLSGTTLPAGAKIYISAYSVNSNSTAVGFTIGSNACTEGNYTTTAAANQAFNRSYTVTASDGIVGTNTFTIKRSTSNKVYLKALYIIGCEEEETYTVTYKVNGGTGSDVIDAAATTISDVPGTFTAPGEMVFMNWNTVAGGTGITYEVGDAVTSDLTLYAQWGWRLTYDANAGGDAVSNLPDPEIHKPGTYTLSTKVPTRAGYTFDGWYYNSGCTGTRWEAGASFTTGALNETLYAKWTATTYTLTVSGAVVDNPMTKGGKTGAISGVTITGSPVSGITSGTTTSTSANTFTVNKAISETVTTSASVSGSSAECDECTYVFDHWTNVPATVTVDVSTIEAVYKTTYTISFKETDGTAVAGISSSSYVYGVGKLASTLPTPSKSGYTFDGWYKENTLTNAATDIANDAWGNVTYYAKWIEDTPTYTITYELYGGSLDGMQKTSYTSADDDYDLPIPTKDNNVFLGWYETYSAGEYSNPISVLASGSTGNKTYHAKWGAAATVNWIPTAKAGTSGFYKGGGEHTIVAIINQDNWDDSPSNGNKDDLVLTASDGVTLHNITITINGDGKAQVSANFDIAGDIEGDVITFHLTIPATETYPATESSTDVPLNACPGGYSVIFTSDHKNDAGEYFDDIASGTSQILGNGIAKMIAIGDCKLYAGKNQDGYRSDRCNIVFKLTKSTDLDIYYCAGSSSRSFALYSFSSAKDLSDIEPSDYSTKTTVTSVTGSKAAFAQTSATSSNPSISSGTVGTSGSGGGIKASYASLSAGYYILKNESSGEGYFYGFDIDGGDATSGIETTLSWSPALADKGTVGKNDTDNDFTYSVATPLTSNTIGAITYTSSDVTVATVNSAGTVHIVGGGSTTITATLAASGCYNSASISYTLNVTSICSDEPGTIVNNDGSTIEDNAISRGACETTTLKIIDYTAGATIQWYKDGATIGGATDAAYTIPAGESGVYSATVVKECAKAKATANSITVTTAGGVNPTIYADEFSVKHNREFYYRLMKLNPGETAVVATAPSGWTENTDFTITIGTDNIVYIRGKVSVASATTKTLTLTISNTCGSSTDKNITIHELVATPKPTIAWIATDSINKGKVDKVRADQSTNTALYKHLETDYTLTPRNCYYSTDEKLLIKEYSKYDLIILTDYPNSQKGPNGDGRSKSYTNAIGLLIDHKPILTFEAFVSGCPNWGFSSNPKDTKATQNTLTLLCNANEIFDPSDKFYAGADITAATVSSGQSLQGFAVNESPDFVYIAKITDDGKDYIACCERQVEPAERMMVFGLNANVMDNITADGKEMVAGFVNYLLIMDPAEIPDCSVIFKGGTAGHETDWYTETNWEGDNLPNQYASVRIDAPCEVGTNASPARAGYVKIHTGSDGVHTYNGHLTINPQGVMIVQKSITRVEGNRYTVHMATNSNDLAIESSEAGNGTLIFDNKEGKSKAFVQMHSKAVKSSATTWQYIGIPHSDVSNAMDNYYGSWLYRWNPTAGWEVVPRGGAVEPWTGYCITYPEEGHIFEMEGTLVATANVDIAVPAGSYQIIGNSWTAPIQIANFEDKDFGAISKTVYFFNTGNDPNGEGKMDKEGGRWAAGTYVSVPIHAAPYTGDAVINSMQGFYVSNSGSAGSIHLDYNKLVRPKSGQSAVQGQMHAPRRMTEASDEPVVLKLLVSGSRYDDRLVVLEREDFTKGHDDGWDGAKWDGSTISPTIWSQNDEGGVESVTATPDMEGTIIGFRAGEDNEYTFHFEYDDMAEPLFLLDMDERMYVRILTGTTYTFTCADKGEHNRFLLTRKAPGIPTGCEPIDGGGGPKAMKFIKDNKLYILLNGVLYDATGKVVE